MSSDKTVDDVYSDSNFLFEMERSLDVSDRSITDFEWELKNRKWDEQRTINCSEMLHNTVWTMLLTRHHGADGASHEPQQGLKHEAKPIDSNATVNSLINSDATRYSATSQVGHATSRKKKSTMVHEIQSTSLSNNASKISWKVPKLSKLELFKYLEEWDKSSYGKRDMMIMKFVKTYRTKEKVYDTDVVFTNGGSLIFCRYLVGLEVCFLKHRKVWHYFDALAIFVKSLQGDRYSEEFMRLGGMNFIIQVVRVEESSRLDKLHACTFLIYLMEGRLGHAIKRFVCDSPHFLESLVDSLTMCKDKKLISSCGQIFQNLCVEIPPKNIVPLCNFVMHAIPCDFNPDLQSMAFKVLQGLVRLKPPLSTRCIKPIMDNLKTEDSGLLVELSNLSLVILQTKYRDELIKSLMVAAEGIHLREVFISNFKPRTQNKGQKEQDIKNELKKAREKRARDRAKQIKFDHYMHQAGALFVLNKVMTSKAEEFVSDFVSKGILGLSLKTLGACPHWEVQGQGVTMIQFLYHTSVECAVAYYLMLPPKMLSLILNKPEECLRYFTSPICVFLRKIGRFALRMWPRFLEKVITPATVYAQGNQPIPQSIFNMYKMASKVHEIQMAMADLMDSPVMEAAPKIEESDGEFIESSHVVHDFLDSSDEENLIQYKGGKDVIMGDPRFEAYQFYLDDTDYQISEDRLDARVDVNKPSVLMKADDDNELDAYQQAILQDAEKTKKDDSKETMDLGEKDANLARNSQDEIPNTEDTDEAAEFTD